MSLGLVEKWLQEGKEGEKESCSVCWRERGKCVCPSPSSPERMPGSPWDVPSSLDVISLFRDFSVNSQLLLLSLFIYFCYSAA